MKIKVYKPYIAEVPAKIQDTNDFVVEVDAESFKNVVGSSGEAPTPN